MGMPPMQNHQHIDYLAAHYRRQRGLSKAANQNNKKRKRTELEHVEQDMEVEEDGKFTFLGLGCGGLGVTEQARHNLN